MTVININVQKIIIVQMDINKYILQQNVLMIVIMLVHLNMNIIIYAMRDVLLELIIVMIILSVLVQFPMDIIAIIQMLKQ